MCWGVEQGTTRIISEIAANSVALRLRDQMDRPRDDRSVKGVETMDSDEIRVAQPAPGRASRGLSVLVVVLACVAAASLGYLLRERERASLLSTDNQEMNANLAQMRARLEALTSKVDGLASQRP